MLLSQTDTGMPCDSLVESLRRECYEALWDTDSGLIKIVPWDLARVLDRLEALEYLEKQVKEYTGKILNDGYIREARGINLYRTPHDTEENPDAEGGIDVTSTEEE